MRKSDKPFATQRRVWRMTPSAPLGEFVEVDDKVDKTERADRPAAPPTPDELSESSWTRSSWDLLNGVEITESSPGDLIEELFGDPERVAPTGHEPVGNAGEWIRRFAIRLAEIDAQRDPREIIEIAKRRWLTQHHLAPEQAAELEGGPESC